VTSHPDAATPSERATGSAAAYEVVAIGSSAGGLAALTETLSTLPAGLPASILVVQHLDPRHRSLLAEILGRRTALTVVQARDGEPIAPGCVYIAPPDQHMLVDGGPTISLTRSELVHFVRPSVDLLFESVAATYRERAIAVVLTGSGSDGAMGVVAVKKMGGTVIAQDERTSDYFAMPSAAIETGSVDFVLPVHEIASALVSLVLGASS
jgi:two-component system chemotaxis response regulator CheB